LLLEMYIHVL